MVNVALKLGLKSENLADKWIHLIYCIGFLCRQSVKAVQNFRRVRQKPVHSMRFATVHHAIFAIVQYS
jgi:hypothetical protein